MRQKNNSSELHYYSDRLQHKLNLLATSSAALVEAPSGYGKTTAVRDYLKVSVPQGADVYWFTAVDEAPGALFWRLCREIEKIDARAGERLLKIDFPNAFTIGETCDALRSMECGRATWLVIDNFQFLCAVGLPPAFLAALLGHGGNALHIVIVTQPLGREYHSAVAGQGFLQVTASDLRLEGVDIRRYYALAGLNMTGDEAQKVLRYTEGWIIAVYLQLRAYRELGAFSDAAVLRLMEGLVWDRLTGAQRTFLLRLSLFESVTVRQACGLLDREALSDQGALPAYALDCLSGPFIRYDAGQRRYEPHAILVELLAQKRAERGAAFERECLLGAGDVCRDEGHTLEALRFYYRVKDYERMLSLDLSTVIFEEVGDLTFFDIALDIARECPAAIRQEYPLSMLRVAWALRAANRQDAFGALLDELDGLLDEDGLLRAEWLLLSAYRHYPYMEKMLPLVQKAAPLFGGASSLVILPDAPWAFGGYCQMSEFHMKAGEADREADALEQFIALYSRLTDGHGSGADALFRTDLAYFRGDMASAEIFAYKAAFLAESRQQSIIQLGAAVMLADIALIKADTAGWQRAISSMERAATQAGRNTYVIRAVLDTVRGVLLAELKAQKRIADWLKNGAFPRHLPEPVATNALYAHAIFLLHQGDFARLLGTLEALPQEIRTKSAYAEFVCHLLLAAGHAALGRREKAVELLEHAAAKGVADGFMTHFAAFSPLLQGLVEELIEKKYPTLLDSFNAAKAQFETGWETLHEAMFADALPSDLTTREREIAAMAADGLRNHEIAQRLSVAENTVRAHLRSIFHKLDVDRRAKLAEKL